MATIDMKLKDLQAIPEAKAVLEKHLPKLMKSTYLKMGKSMTFRTIAGFPQLNITPEQLDEIEKDLQAI
jgi:hypothetical protein